MVQICNNGGILKKRSFLPYVPTYMDAFQKAIPTSPLPLHISTVLFYLPQDTIQSIILRELRLLYSSDFCMIVSNTGFSCDITSGSVTFPQVSELPQIAMWCGGGIKSQEACGVRCAGLQIAIIKLYLLYIFTFSNISSPEWRYLSASEQNKE